MLDDVPIFMLGGGDGGGSGADADDPVGGHGAMVPLFALFIAELLLALLLLGGAYESADGGGGGGMTRSGPFIGKCGVPSLSAEE